MHALGIEKSEPARRGWVAKLLAGSAVQKQLVAPVPKKP